MNELKCRFVGVDWASENHRVRITDGCGMRVGQRDFAHGGTGSGRDGRVGSRV
jgi:hypothetical protein